MGCAQSKIDNEESVARCKDRRNFMKEAVSFRNAFAAGQSGYAVALKNSGAALSAYAQGEAENNDHNNDTHDALNYYHHGAPATPPPPPPIMDATTLPPPPPPLPTFSPITPPLQRSSTMPELAVPKMNRKMKSVAIDEEDEEGYDVGNEERDLHRRQNGTPEPPPPPLPEMKGMSWDFFYMVENMPGPSLSESEDVINEQKDESDDRFHEVEMKTPEKVAVARGFETEEEEMVTPVNGNGNAQFMHSNTAPHDYRRGSNSNYGKVVGGSSVNLLKILGDIDDHFLKASEAAQEVSKMLEATRMHYHSNFADNRGHIDHAARVMQVITWNKSFRGVPNGDGMKDDFDTEEYETHATVLDKLLAWEKKLYEEVKAGELMKLEYQRKVSLLNKLKKRNASTESLEKTKAAVSHLHTRYIVDMQSMDSTVSEVNHIRDDQLYPKLVGLVNGMAKMWELMCTHHNEQLRTVTDLKSLEISGAPKETTKHHLEQTKELCNVIEVWQSQFEKLSTNQKHYIQALNSWLKLNLIPIESSLKEKISSPPRIQNPPIQVLLHSWHDHLEKLPDELAKSAIASFAAVIKTIMLHQEEEMKLKDKCEETRKELLRKSQAFDDWYQKHHRRTQNDDMEPDRGSNHKDPISEKRFVVESLNKRLEEEVEAHRKMCVQVRDKSLGSLKIRLPELFRSMSDYSHACFEGYEGLRLITQSQSGNGRSS
ncbi:protein ALTERED PHOSPHATE STARVATION RESPONSE 1-like isoform X2 [Rhododendron vialii]|uniref:protein ALTERED PHOSPHATE STARVATION RESPONSE 1-like isoform X2 n=1 Tax=Rhododendron vialii TaxID=182163 RepID=UPI00265F85D3|nr:protein ALTERED PHOSPHATE STARVATION RESPONSE 1-like isoform X2 [Rhododendron vialii]